MGLDRKSVHSLRHVKKVLIEFLSLALIVSTVSAISALTAPSANAAYTTGSADFGGSDRYLTVANGGDFAVGTGDFTVEWWQRMTAAPTSNSNNVAQSSWPRVFDLNGTFQLSIEDATTPTVYFWLGSGGATALGTLTNFSSSHQNQWKHLAITRTSSTVRFYIGGALINSFSMSGNVTNTTDPLYIGRQSADIRTLFPGQITNFHFIKGTSKYGSLSTLTGLTAPFVPTDNTKLLLKFESSGSLTTDSSSINKSVTNTGAVGWSNLSPSWTSNESQTITFTNPGNKTLGSGTFLVAPTSSSGLTVAVTSATTNVCTVSGTTVTLVDVGTCTLSANQSGNANFAAATQVQQSLTVSHPVCSSPTSTSSGGYTYVAFKNLGTCTWTPSPGVSKIDLLVVAGGGGGGSRHAGGGGAGGLRNSTNLDVNGGSLTIVVGDGGNGGGARSDNLGNQGANGSNSSVSGGGVSTLTAIGGGGGTYDSSGGNGGSGGGGGCCGQPPGNGTDGQGNSGSAGFVTAPYYLAGGGGGAGTAGVAATGASQTALNPMAYRAGLGGTGAEVIWIPTSVRSTLGVGVENDSKVFFAGGGGGGTGSSGTGGTGGTGGGGAGATTTGNPTAGTSNTGGGGGGAGLQSNNTTVAGGKGGSGVVVVRYANPTRTITYGLNSGTGTAPTQAAVSEGASFVVASGSGLARDGFTFSGWNDGSSDYAAGSTYTVGASAITLNAIWNSNSRTVTFNANDGSGSPATATQTVTSGVSATLRANTFTRSGYEFLGWTTNANGSGTTYLDQASFSTTTSVILYASWFLNTDIVSEWGSSTFTSTNPTWSPMVGTINVTRTNSASGATSWTPATSTSPAYANGSSTAEIFVTASNMRSQFSNSSVSIFAWAYPLATNHAVIQERSNNSFVTSPTTHQTIIEMVSGVYNFILPGCTPIAAGSSTSINAWHHVGLTYDGTTLKGYVNGVEVASGACTRTMPTTDLYYGVGGNDGNDMNPSAQVKGNYRLSSLQIFKSAVSALKVQNLYLYSTITFKSNFSGGVADTVQKISNGSSTNLTANSFTRSSIPFIRWSNTSITNSSYLDAAQVNLRGNLILYAQWGYTITYKPGNFSTGSDLIGYKNHGVNTSVSNGNSTFSRTGYSISGWSTNADGPTTDYALSASYTTDANLILYPVWLGSTYTVTYSYNSATGGNTDLTGSYINGGTALTLPVPTRTGFSFGGWFEASNLSGAALELTYSPTQSRTIYAKWTALSNVATLSALVLSSGTLSPVFASGTITYTASVANSVATGFTVTPTTTQANATTLQYLGATGTTAFTGALSVGANVIRTVVTAQDGSTTSTYSVTVTRLAAAVAPSIGTQPTAAARTVGQSVTFTVAATASDSGDLSYQWQKGGSNIAGATLASYTFTPSAISDAGNYQVIVTNTKNSTTATTTSTAVKLAIAGTNNHRNFARNTAGTFDSPGNSFKSTQAVIPRSGSFTLDGWFRESTALANQNIVFSQGRANVAGFGIMINGSSSARKISLFNGSNFSTATDSLSQNVWYHFAVTYNHTTSVLKLFLNGIEVGSQTSATPVLTDDFFIGKNSYYLEHAFHGQQDQFKVWTAALSAEEIALSMHAYGEGSVTGKTLRTLYDFNHTGATSTLTDVLGGFDLSANGSGSNSTWASSALNVTFDEQGGSPAATDTTFDFYTKIADPGSPTKAGHTFSGWSRTSNGSVISFPYIFTPLETIKLFAIWSANSNTVTFNANDGSGTPATSTQSITSGTATALTANAFTRTGYTFAGWDTAADGSGTDYTNQQSVTITSGMTLYAKWTGNTYIVTYTYNGATGANTTATSSFTVGGSSVTLPTPTRTNFTFNGWFDSGLTNKVADGGASYSPTASITLYAKWTYSATGWDSEIDYALDFDGTNDSAISASKVINSTAFTLELWVNYDGTRTGSARTIVSQYQALTQRIHVAINSSNQLQYAWGGSTTDAIATAEYALLSNRWIHIALTRSSSGIPKLYIDGVLIATSATANTGIPNAGLKVGDLSNEMFDGELDQLKIWSAELSQSEIQASMHSLGATQLSGSAVASGKTLVAYYDFNEGTGSTVHDRVGSANLTSSGGPVYRDVKTTTSLSGGATVVTFPRTYLSGIGGWKVPTGVTSVRTLVVAGGGGGGTDEGGGGGAGGFTETNTQIVSGIEPVIVGQGGVGGYGSDGVTQERRTTSGQNSSFGTGGNKVTTIGGGAGGDSTAATLNGVSVRIGLNGGSGGGSAGENVTSARGTGTSGQGNNGEVGAAFGGGGGGAGGAGGAQTGGGGLGKQSSITGSSLYYAAGGSGGKGNLGSGGRSSTNGIGGAGGSTTSNATAGATNTGSGGGGGQYRESPSAGAEGGTGVVILRYIMGYEVTFAGGADGTGDDQAVTKTQGVALTLPNSSTANSYFTRAGYTVTGWALTDGGAQAYALGGSFTTDATTTLYPVWTASSNTVIFNNNSGTGSMSNQSIISGTATALTTNTFIRPGYIFAGWNTNADGISGTSYTDGASVTITTGMTLYAIWAAGTNTVIFDANGGAGTIANQSITSGTATALTSNTFTRTGYTFAGWNTNADGTSGTSYTDGQSVTLTAGVTIYAKWTAGTNTVSFNANSGTGTIANQSITSGTATALTSNTFTRSGYTFAGWNTNADGTSGTAYTDGQSVTLTSGLTVYAKWTANTNTVIFNNNSGSGSMSNQSISTGVSATLTSNTYTRAGYTFAGWNTNADGTSGTAYTDGQTVSLTEGMTLYAKWTANTLVVTFDSQSGTAVTAGSVLTGANLSAPTPPTKAGYVFSGWSTTSTGSVVSFTGGYAHGQTASFTLYAIWAANALTVTYESKGGSAVTAGSVDTGASITSAPTAPTKAGYTLSGWSATDGGIVVTFPYAHGQTANFTLYAIWTGNTNTITYNSKGGSAILVGSFVTGGSIASAPTEPIRAGYNLAGWSLTDGGSVITYPYSPTATAGITLYAIWTGISCSPSTTTTGGYTIYTFTTAGTCFWTVPNGITDVEILAVGGGGGGGYAWDNAGAGGGAGGQVKTGAATLSTTLEVTVGAGGSAGTTASRRGGTGGSSAVSTLTALGGTGGCSARATTCSIAAQATALAGATGGAGGAGGASGRGGGGSNTAGVAPTTTTGGTGTASTYSGSSVTYGVGGVGGTARGFGTNITGTAGSVNTGNGGAGASAMNSSGDVNGGAGAVGLVIVRIASALTITFDSQSGSTVSDGSTMTGAIIATAPTDPTRTNYIFLGWFSASTGGSAISFPYTHGRTANFTLYAQWALNSYSIVFNANNGSGSMANQTITHGVALNLNANLISRANYVFHRWATNADGSGTTYNNLAQVTLTAGTTLYAQWTANTYVLTYIYNGADGGESPATAGFTTAGTAITLPVPTRTGFTFAGWHSDAALTTLIGSNNGSGTYTPTGATLSLNAYAKWTAINYTFTYDANSADSGTVPTETSKQITQTATVKANTGSLVRAGYTFSGWNTTSNGTGNNYLSGSLFTVGSSNVILYAKWSPNTYTITYNTNGGSGNAQRTVSSVATNVTSDSYTTGGASVVLPDAGTLTRTGYTFGGWNTSAAGTGTNYSATNTYTTVSNVIFYVKWNPVTYTITYDGNSSNGGSTPTAGGYTTGQASPYVVLANTFTKTSSIFGGWNTASNGTGISYSPGASITTLANIVLYAVWIPQFTLHYAINGGTVNAGSTRPADALLNVNTAVSVFSALSRTGYTFDGWTNGATTIAPNGSFVIVEDSVLTAKWTAVNYSISYNSDGGTEAPATSTKQIGQSFSVGAAVSKPGYNFTGWSNGSSVVGADAVVVMGSANIAYTAQWVARVYTVAYDWNGGRGTAESDVNYTFGTTAITLPLVGDRIRDGFTFAGWSESLGGSALSATYIPSQSRTLYALWTVGNFTVTYNLSGGTLANASASVQNGSATVLPLPTRANFVFDGWHTATTGGSSVGSNGASFTPTASQTVYARWIQSSLYGITNSLTRIGSVVTVANVANTFSGANSNSSVSVSVPANALPAGTTINFDMVGNSSRATGLLPNVSYLISIAISWLTGDGLVPDTTANNPISVVISNATIKAGAAAYAIVNNVSTLLGTASQDGTITIALTSDPEIVIAATKPDAPTNIAATSNGNQQSVISWSAPASNGGSAITGYTVTSSPAVTAPAGCTNTTNLSCTFTGLATGTAYTFTVTATNSVGTSIVSTTASATTASLFAVTFDAKNGTPVSNGSFLTASTVSEPTAPTRAGYSFAGWSATDGGSAITYPYAPGVTAAITLFARWDALDNAVTFNSKSGSDVTASIFSSGGTVAEPTAPTRSGFTFAGWSATDGGPAVTFPYAPGVVTDIVLYARWTAVSQNNSGGNGGGNSGNNNAGGNSGNSNAGGNGNSSSQAGSTTPSRGNVTTVAPVTVVGDAATKVPTIEISVPSTESGGKPPVVKIDKASEKFIAEVKVVDGKLALTPETGFSGKQTVTVTVNEGGAERIIQIPLTVLPEAVTKPVLTPTASNRTLIRWTESPNANAYTVLLNGKRVCATSASSCSINRVLGPDAVIEIVSNGEDRTVSQRIEADFRQTAAVQITRLVSPTITKAALTKVDIKALDKVIALIKSQGFGTVVISEITTTKRTAALAESRIALIKKYINDKLGSEKINFEVVAPEKRTYFNNISVKG